MNEFDQAMRDAGWFTAGAFVATVAAIAIILTGCTPATSPDTVYSALVEAGCLAASSDGVQSIAQEHADPGRPPWLDCLFDGGTVVACHVPCD